MRALKSVFWLTVMLFVAGCSGFQPAPEGDAMPNIIEEASQEPVNLPDLGVAPELENKVWLNTPTPLRLAGLRGQVVLINFWTFG